MKAKLFCASALGIAGCFPATSALAQEAPATESTSEVPEIIVVARKRAESLDDVPSSVTALTADDQQNLVLDSMGDYLKQTAGALLVSAGPDYLSDISIRGQGGGRNGFSESATGIYRNGIFVAGGGFGGRSFNRLDYYDNERVEVYRGPQGALYGRNAVGGAVNVVSRKPTMDLGASGSFEYGAADKFKFESVMNAPIVTDRVALRFGAIALNQGDGDIVDVNTGQTLDTQKFRGLRGSVLGKISEGWEARFTYEHYTSEAAGFSALGQRLAAGLAAGRRFDPGRYLRNASRVGRVNISDDSLFAELEGDLGFATLSAVYTHKSRNGGRSNEDLDHFLGLEGLTGVDLTVAQTEDYKRDGAEVRLASKGSGPLTWLIGTDWQDSNSDVVTQNGGSVPATSSAALRAQAVRKDTSSENLKSWSVFGSLDYAFSSKLSGGVELRYQRDTKDFQFQRVDLVTGTIQTSNPTWNEVLPVATLRYKMGEQQVYARFATGFRPGGFNLGVTDLTLLAYNPEKAKSFELGVKGRIPSLKLRFDVAGYYTTTDNLQVVTAASATDTTFTLQNVPGAKLWGGEAQVSGVLPIGTGRLRYSVGVATQDGRFDSGSRVIVTGRTVDLSNARVNRARDLTLNLSGFYSYPLSDSLDLVSGGSLRLENGGFENATGGTTDVSARKLEGFTTLDVRTSLRAPNWTLSAFAKNLTDKSYVLQNINGNNYYNERARYGIELTIKVGGER
jgi:iron complex outermembrane recepter protein